MGLHYNPNPKFTLRLVNDGILTNPLVVVDAGVQGGMHPRWRALGRRLSFHGFDALTEAVAPLLANAGSGEHYHTIALGDEDGERILSVPEISYASSFKPRVLPPDQKRLAIDPGNTAQPKSRTVPVRRIDSLLSDGTLPGIDAFKMDCEGFEPEIVKGMVKSLSHGDALAIETETGFTRADYAQTHFVAVMEQLLPYRFALADLDFDRIPYAAYVNRAKALGSAVTPEATRSRPATFDVLFFRDLTSAPNGVGTDAIVKQAIIFELYGMNDAAYDVLNFFSDRLPADVLAAMDDLVPVPPPPPSQLLTVREAVTELGRALHRSARYRLSSLRT
jgi:FkbM family methyltransferase